MNHHLLLFQRNNKQKVAKPEAPFLSDAKAAPLLEEIVMHGNETTINFRYRFDHGSTFSKELDKLLTFLKNRDVYVVYTNYQKKGMLSFYLTQEKLDLKFKNICSDYHSTLQNKNSCGVS